MLVGLILIIVYAQNIFVILKNGLEKQNCCGNAVRFFVNLAPKLNLKLKS